MWARPRKYIPFIACVIALFTLLLILIGGLDQVKLLPGKAFPNPFANLSRTGDERSLTAERGVGKDAFQTTVRLLIIIILIVTVVFSILSRQFRWQLIAIAIIFGLALGLFSFLNSVKQDAPPMQSEDDVMCLGGQGPQDLQPLLEPNIPRPSAPTWLVVLLAMGVGLLTTIVTVMLALKILPKIRNRPAKNQGLLDELAEQANNAVGQIQAGDNPYQVVLSCYKEMTKILSSRQGVHNSAYLTPREFSSLLRARGMRDTHIDQLTSIFEQVRYGARSQKSFADEAVTCLTLIQNNYKLANAK